MWSTSSQTNGSDIAMTEENEDNTATISQCSQTEFPSDNDILFWGEEKNSSEEEEEVKSENEPPKGGTVTGYWSCLWIHLQGTIHLLHQQ